MLDVKVLDRAYNAGRSAVVLSAGALGVCVAGLNLVLGATGVWQACSYRLPLIVLAAMYLLVPIVFSALLLMGYRWLVRHTRYPALVYGAVLLFVALQRYYLTGIMGGGVKE